MEWEAANANTVRTKFSAVPTGFGARAQWVKLVVTGTGHHGEDGRLALAFLISLALYR